MPEKNQTDGMNEAQLRSLVESLIHQVSHNNNQIQIISDQLKFQQEELARRDHEIKLREQEIKWRDAKIEKLTHEIAVLNRWKFGRSREHLSAEQLSLFDETLDADLLAVEEELAELRSGRDDEASGKSTVRRRPVRTLLPEGLARTEFLHEPDSTACATPGCGKPMQRIGQSVTDKLHYTPGTFSVHRHVRGKWVCRCCDKLVQEPVPAQVIDKGLPTAGLLAYVLVAKYADHLPLARQEHIFGRAGVAIPRSTLAQWVGHCGVQLQPLVDALRTEVLACPVLHADETPVQMLKPGIGKTHRAYLWVYAPAVFDPLRAVIYDFCESRAGKHANAFLAGWQGHLVVDDYKGYKQLLGRDGITEVGCLAHARRKFFDLNQANQSTLATKALEYFSLVYDIERDVRNASTEERLRMRQQHTKPALKAMQDWMTLQRQKVPEGSATAKALDYSLRRWDALTRFVDHGGLPADNNHVERQIRPIAVGRSNWLFAGSLRGGERAAAVMSLVHSARLNGLDPLAYLTDVLERLPTHKMSAIGELLPHRWTPPVHTTAA
jgi:transposase